MESRQFGRIPDTVDRTVNLDARVHKWLAALLSDESAETFRELAP